MLYKFIMATSLLAFSGFAEEIAQKSETYYESPNGEYEEKEEYNGDNGTETKVKKYRDGTKTKTKVKKEKGDGWETKTKKKVKKYKPDDSEYED